MSRYVNLFLHSSGCCAFFFCDGGGLVQTCSSCICGISIASTPWTTTVIANAIHGTVCIFFLGFAAFGLFKKRFRAVWVERWEMLDCEKDMVFYYFFLFLCSLSKGSNQFISNIPEGRSWEEKPRSRRNAEQAGSFCVSVADQGNLHNMQTRYEKGLGPWLVGFYK